MDQIINTAIGTQWLGDFANCKCDAALLKFATTLELACEDIVSTSGIHIMGRAFHQFSPDGVTGLFLLAESHLAIHTWPEFSSVAIDLYVCNVTEDNGEKAKNIFAQLITLFAPLNRKQQVLQRGWTNGYQ
jgi:S-adenosylmethionine decarboxylase proenzyme